MQLLLENKIKSRIEFLAKQKKIKASKTDQSQCIQCLFDEKSKTLPVKANLISKNSELEKNKKETLNSQLELEYKKLTNPTKIHFHKLSIKHFIPKNLELAADLSVEKSENFIKIYLSFINSIDFEAKENYIRDFDLNIYSNLLTFGISDIKIDEFVDKLLKDPFCYEKTKKTTVFYIFIFAYLYCLNSKKDTVEIKRKIEIFSCFFKSKRCFDLCLTKDNFINKYILNLKKITADFDEAMLLNKIYMLKSKDKILNEGFHERLLENIGLIDPEYLISFLKLIFTHSTVLFNMINNINLFKLIYSYYTSNYKTDKTISLLNEIFDKCPSFEFYSLISKDLRLLIGNKEKYRKILYKIEINDLNGVKEFKNYFEIHYDSFDAISFGLNYLRNTFIHSSNNYLIFAEILMQIFDKMKTEFFKELCIKITVFASQVLNKIKTIDSLFLEFNEKYWNTLSRLVLACERMSIENSDDAKKKKNNSSRPCVYLKESLKLIEIATKLEVEAEKRNPEIIKLKKRGFMIE